MHDGGPRIAGVMKISIARGGASGSIYSPIVSVCAFGGKSVGAFYWDGIHYEPSFPLCYDTAVEVEYRHPLCERTMSMYGKRTIAYLRPRPPS